MRSKSAVERLWWLQNDAVNRRNLSADCLFHSSIARLLFSSHDVSFSCYSHCSSFIHPPLLYFLSLSLILSQVVEFKCLALNRTQNRRHLCTRVGTLMVATIYLQLIQNRYMFRSFTVLQCSYQHCVQPVASDVEVVGYL